MLRIMKSASRNEAGAEQIGTLRFMFCSCKTLHNGFSRYFTSSAARYFTYKFGYFIPSGIPNI